MPKSIRYGLATTVTLLAMCSTTAVAEPLLFLRVQATGDGSPGGPNGGYTSNEAGTMTTVGAFDVFTASAVGRVDFGSLGGYARADAGQMCTTNQSGHFPNLCNRQGTLARVESRWADDFTIVSAQLPNDTWVDFVVTMQLHGFVSHSETHVRGSADPPSRLSATAQTTLTGLPDGMYRLQKSRDIADGFVHPMPNPQGTVYSSMDDGDLLTIEAQLQVGHTYTLTQTLFVIASTNSMFDAWAESAFLSTARLFLAPAGVGYGYFTASGTRYEPAVSVNEPLTLLLLIPAAGVCLRRRRSRWSATPR